jgi:hypothetical protein
MQDLRRRLHEANRYIPILPITAVGWHKDCWKSGLRFGSALDCCIERDRIPNVR